MWRWLSVLFLPALLVDCRSGTQITVKHLANAQAYAANITAPSNKNIQSSSRRRRRRRRRSLSLPRVSLQRTIDLLKQEVGALLKDRQSAQNRISSLEARVGSLEGMDISQNASKSSSLVDEALKVLKAELKDEVSDGLTSDDTAVAGLFRAFHLVWTAIPEDLHKIINTSPRLSELARRGALSFGVIEQNALREPAMKHLQEAAANWGYDVSVGIAEGRAARVGPPRPKEALVVAQKHLSKASSLLSNLQENIMKLRTYQPPSWPDELACTKKMVGATCKYRFVKACPPAWLGPCVRTSGKAKTRHGICVGSFVSAENGLRCEHLVKQRAL